MSDLRDTTPEEKEALEYLNDLRESVATNMFGAAPYVQEEMGVDRNEARRLTRLWMDNFNAEGNYNQVKVEG